MQKIFSRILAVAGAVVGLVGCQSSQPGGGFTAPTLSTEVASAAGLSIQDINHANTLYAAKCAKCHKFYHPADYMQKEWDGWMRKMSRKSKLNPAQEELLTRYLAAFRTVPATLSK